MARWCFSQNNHSLTRPKGMITTTNLWLNLFIQQSQTKGHGFDLHNLVLWDANSGFPNLSTGCSLVSQRKHVIACYHCILSIHGIGSIGKVSERISSDPQISAIWGVMRFQHRKDHRKASETKWFSYGKPDQGYKTDVSTIVSFFSDALSLT